MNRKELWKHMDATLKKIFMCIIASIILCIAGVLVGCFAKVLWLSVTLLLLGLVSLIVAMVLTKRRDKQIRQQKAAKTDDESADT